jgi:Polyketide cyclase / dehydrase and lipid transport
VTKISGGIVIGRPIDVVFDVVADQRNEPSYNPVMTHSEKLTDGSIGVGTEFRATITARGRPVQMLIEYTAFDRPRLLASTTSMATADIRGTLTFSPHPSGTQMRWSWEVTPRGALKLLAPIIALAGRRRERRIWTGLKQQLETTAASRPGSP